MPPDEDPRAVVRDLLAVVDAEPAFQDAVQRLAEGLARRLGWDAAALWMLDEQGGRLRCAAAWAADPDDAKEFERGCRDSTYAEGEGLPGRAWRSRVPVWSTDLADEPRLAALADDRGFPGAYVFPLIDEDRLVGVVELIARERHEEDVNLQRALVSAGTELGRGLARRLAQETAGAERARLDVALAAGRMGVWDWDLASNRLRWSDTLEAMVGLAPGAFTGTVEDYVELVHPDDRDWVVEGYLQQFEHRGDRHIQLEHRVVRPDGEVRWLEIRGRALQDPSGELVAMTGVAVDVTEATEREQTARAQRAQLDLAMEVGGVGTWEFDRRLRVGRWSEAMVEMMGGNVDPDAVSVEEIMIALHPDDRGVVDAMVDAAAGGRDFHACFRLVRPDGEVRRLESWGRPLHDVAGEMLGMAGITIDVTDRPTEDPATGEER